MILRMALKTLKTLLSAGTDIKSLELAQLTYKEAPGRLADKE